MKKTITLLTLSFIASLVLAQNPIAKINVSKSIWCENAKINFGNQSLNADSFFWYMGNGTTFTTKKVTYFYSIDALKDSFIVSLVAVDKATGKKDSTTQLIRVQKSAKAYYDFKAIAVVCFFYPKCENYLGLDWSYGDGGSDLKDADSITHVYPGTGTYICQLIATTDFQCNDTFKQEIHIVDSAGGSISENNLYQMQLFPNPAKDQILSFEVQKPEHLSISISDATGKLISSLNNTYQIGIHQVQLGKMLINQPTGLYFVTINNERAIYVLKSYKTE